MDDADIQYNDFQQIIKQTKKESLKIILFKCNVTNYVPYIKLTKKLNNDIIETLLLNQKLQRMFERSSINLFDGIFGFLST